MIFDVDETSFEWDLPDSGETEFMLDGGDVARCRGNQINDRIDEGGDGALGVATGGWLAGSVHFRWRIRYFAGHS